MPRGVKQKRVEGDWMIRVGNRYVHALYGRPSTIGLPSAEFKATYGSGKEGATPLRFSRYRAQAIACIMRFCDINARIERAK